MFFKPDKVITCNTLEELENLLYTYWRFIREDSLHSHHNTDFEVTAHLRRADFTAHPDILYWLVTIPWKHWKIISEQCVLRDVEDQILSGMFVPEREGESNG